MSEKIKIIRPQEGFQEKFVRTNVDFCVGGGVLNCGKSFAACLSVAEPSQDGEFKALFYTFISGLSELLGAIITYLFLFFKILRNEG